MIDQRWLCGNVMVSIPRRIPPRMEKTHFAVGLLQRESFAEEFARARNIFSLLCKDKKGVEIVQIKTVLRSNILKIN